MCVCAAVDSSVAGPVMSIKRIEEAIAVSPLLDEEVESLVQLLIQKKEENAEWQGVSGEEEGGGRGGWQGVSQPLERRERGMARGESTFGEEGERGDFWESLG